MRAVLDEWIGEGRPRITLETERPDELEPFSFTIEEAQLEQLKEATVDWSTARTLVDQSTIVRALVTRSVIASAR